MKCIHALLIMTVTCSVIDLLAAGQDKKLSTVGCAHTPLCHEGSIVTKQGKRGVVVTAVFPSCVCGVHSPQTSSLKQAPKKETERLQHITKANGFLQEATEQEIAQFETVFRPAELQVNAVLDLVAIMRGHDFDRALKQYTVTAFSKACMARAVKKTDSLTLTALRNPEKLGKLFREAVEFTIDRAIGLPTSDR